MNFSRNQLGKIAMGIVFLAAASTARSGPEAASPRPVDPLKWLVGGVWTADASKLGPGMKRIETRYQWADNNAYIRFTTHFVTEKGTLKNYDGNFYWNSDQSTLAVWYMDAASSITQGPVKLDGDTMQIEFRATNFEGKPADLRVNVVRVTNDHYSWHLEEKAGEGWKPLAALEYLRVAG